MISHVQGAGVELDLDLLTAKNIISLKDKERDEKMKPLIAAPADYQQLTVHYMLGLNRADIDESCMHIRPILDRVDALSILGIEHNVQRWLDALIGLHSDQEPRGTSVELAMQMYCRSSHTYHHVWDLARSLTRSESNVLPIVLSCLKTV